MVEYRNRSFVAIGLLVVVDDDAFEEEALNYDGGEEPPTLVVATLLLMAESRPSWNARLTSQPSFSGDRGSLEMERRGGREERKRKRKEKEKNEGRENNFKETNDRKGYFVPVLGRSAKRFIYFW